MQDVTGITASKDKRRGTVRAICYLRKESSNRARSEHCCEIKAKKRGGIPALNARTPIRKKGL